MVFPVSTVTLGQSMAVVIGQSLYFMGGLWDRMNEKEVAMAGRAANLGREWLEDHPVALATVGRLQELCGRGSCCSHTGYPQHLLQWILDGRALILGLEDPGTQSRRRIYVDSLKIDCEVCEGWINWKNAVPRYRPDGSLYYIDHDPRGRTPTGSMPPGMTGSRAMSEDRRTSMSPTPEEFTPAPGLERDMDWEALDSRLDQVQKEKEQELG